MSARRGGLGRGLGALIPRGQEEEQHAAAPRDPDLESAMPGARYAEVPIDAITPNPRQPRTHFDEEALEDLAHSIREVGLLQPVVVRERAPGHYELVMGERRWRAARAAGLVEVPALVRETEDTALLRDALLENLHRQQLNPLEEAAAYQQLLEEFEATHDELAARLGRSRPVISNTLRLLQLPGPVQRRIAAGVLSAGHARALLSLDDASSQEAIAARVVSEGLSVRAVEEMVAVAPSSGPSRRRRARREAPPELQELTERLADRLDTRVRLEPGRAKGRLVVEFAGVEDLRRIVTAMGLDQALDEVSAPAPPEPGGVGPERDAWPERWAAEGLGAELDDIRVAPRAARPPSPPGARSAVG